MSWRTPICESLAMPMQVCIQVAGSLQPAGCYGSFRCLAPCMGDLPSLQPKGSAPAFPYPSGRLSQPSPAGAACDNREKSIWSLGAMPAWAPDAWWQLSVFRVARPAGCRSPSRPVLRVRLSAPAVRGRIRTLNGSSVNATHLHKSTSQIGLSA